MRQPRVSTEAGAAARDESRLRELDRRQAGLAAAAAGLAITARHRYAGSGGVPRGGGVEQFTGWTASLDGGQVTRDGGAFTLTPGRWIGTLACYSDAGVAGNFGIAVAHATWFGAEGSLRLAGYTGAGFAGAGFRDDILTFGGVLNDEDAAAPLSISGRWYAADNATSRSVSYVLMLDLLGTQ